MRNKTIVMTAMITAAGLALASIPAFSQSMPDSRNTGNSKSPASPSAERKRPPPPQGRFDKMATRLQITPAQQSVWAQYRRAVEAAQSVAITPAPAGDTDAVTMLRWRADRAADSARRMSAIADATDVLQRSLDGEQRKALNEMTKQEFQSPPDTAREPQRAEGSAAGDKPADNRRAQMDAPPGSAPRPPMESPRERQPR